MKIAEINSVNYGSTGNIMFSLSDIAAQHGHLVICTSGFTKRKVQKGNWFLTSGVVTKSLHIILSLITGYHGCFSFIPTYRLIRKLNKYSPDVIHLHNLHGWYINLPILFSYIKRNNIRTIWTLHDCWAFTGQCPHFTMVKCDRWKTACFGCPQYRSYPQSLVDRTRKMYELKMKWFKGVRNMTIVTPSNWLADLVRQSFLQEYPVEVIHNGVDLTVFKPTESDFRERYCLQNKFIVLGVAYDWGKRKGLDVFIDLAKRLDDRFQIILVGTDSNVDKHLVGNIISFHRTCNQKELAKIYTAADIFVNPSREENYPTVNMEAIACGIPVITFDTGGGPEILDETCGSVVPCDDIDAMQKEIIRVCETSPYSRGNCLCRAYNFDAAQKFKQYIQLYHEICKDDLCKHANHKASAI